ncbi:MAG: helix-turn-helix transcriptional regulator [Selenomonadaceae bacterium]|nr:helix-turn-helix transcriptional regulator [Selenomonadaceae bacterium]
MFRVTLNVEIGKRIRVIRELQKKTREQIAEIANISPQFLFEIETGRKSMKAQTIINLSKALEVTTDYILTGNNNAPTSKILKNLENLPSNALNIAEKFLEIFAEGAQNYKNKKI